MVIWAIGKDPGGRLAIFPVVKKLRAKGHEALFFVDQDFLGLIAPEEEGIIAAKSPEQLFMQYPLPDALVTSMCTGDSIGRALVPKLKKKNIPTVAVQDFWGGRLWTDWRDRKFWPDFICVNDILGAKLVSTAWGKYDPSKIKITGYPALDKYAGFDRERNAARVRSAMQLDKPWPIVLFSGQIEKSGAALQELVIALNDIGRPVYLVTRMHPRMRREAPQEIARWDAAVAKRHTGAVISDTSGLSTAELLSVSTVVVSMFSTVLVETAALQVQNISILYPRLGMDLWKKKCRSKMKGFPLVELGCSAKAGNHDELVKLLKKSFSQGLGLANAQKKYFSLDGKNSERVASVLTEALR